MSEYGNNIDIGQELGWDDEISQEMEFELLPAGTYDFKVESMERGRFGGSEKMAPCNMANLRLQVYDPISGKSGSVFDTLYLNSKAEWRLSQFFTAIGQKKKGEPLRPNWTMVPGSSGKVEIEINRYQDKNGNQKENNKVKRYIQKDEPKSFTAGTF